MARRTLALALLLLGLSAPIAAAETPTPVATATPARVAYPGGLDRTFGVGGLAERMATDVVWRAVAVQADGHIVVAGDHGFGSGVVVARYTAAGEIDATFGTEGVVEVPLERGGHASAVAITDRDEIVVVGTANVPNGTDVVLGAAPFVARLDADGRLDPAFAGGIVVLDLEIDGTGQAVVAQSAGRLVVLANESPRSGTADAAAVLVRLRSNGLADAGFGVEGMARVESPGGRVVLSGLAEAPDGDLLVAATESGGATENERVELVRFDRDGRAPRTLRSYAGFATGIAVTADGGIVLGGGYSDEARGESFALVRFEATGRIDQRFGDHGGASVPEGVVYAVILDASGRVLVVGQGLSRFSAAGAIDETFGVGGRAESPTLQFGAAAVQPDGKILVAGGACFSNPKAGSGCINNLARYESDDTRFCGDADASGVFSVSDGVAVLRAAAGLDDGCRAAVCDVDGSGAIGVTDGVNVLRAAAGLPATLSCGIP